MAEITASAVKSLRERTGAGMMDCKRALEETGGDEEEAIDLLRQQGAAKAAKRAGKETTEGTVEIAGGDGEPASMVEVTCETDFVAKNDDFVDFARRAAREALDADVPEGEIRDGDELLDRPADDPLREELNELRAAIGEAIGLSRFVRIEPDEGSVIGQYVHFGNKIGALVEVGDAAGEDGAHDLARDLAMHVAATDPIGVGREDIPEEERERERKVLREQALEQDKPPEIVDKIVEGRMRKFFEQNTFLEQGFVRDSDVSVEDLIEERVPGATVRRFVRFEIGS